MSTTKTLPQLPPLRLDQPGVNPGMSPTESTHTWYVWQYETCGMVSYKASRTPTYPRQGAPTHTVEVTHPSLMAGDPGEVMDDIFDAVCDHAVTHLGGLR